MNSYHIIESPIEVKVDENEPLIINMYDNDPFGIDESFGARMEASKWFIPDQDCYHVSLK